MLENMYFLKKGQPYMDREPREGAGGLTLARKLDTVQRKTVTIRSMMPMVLLGMPHGPGRDRVEPERLLASAMGMGTTGSKDVLMSVGETGSDRRRRGACMSSWPMEGSSCCCWSGGAGGGTAAMSPGRSLSPEAGEGCVGWKRRCSHAAESAGRTGVSRAW